MSELSGAGMSIAVALCLIVGSGGFVGIPPHSSSSATNQKEQVVMHHANGTFEVQMTPRAPDDKDADATVGRMSIDKQFHGDLEATSTGQMLAVRTEIEGSAGYVAMEHVSGSLAGRSGSFVLQHSGVMARGVPQLSVTVVPDSGTGQLVGLHGNMTIEIVDGNHSYDFEYTLPEIP